MSNKVDNTTEIRGLGDAIKRLVEVQFQLMNRFGDPTAMNMAEIEMLLQALNQYELIISFACDIDGDGDIDEDDMEVDLIKKSARSKMKKGVSCCRIQPTDFTRQAKKPANTDQFTIPKVANVGISVGDEEEQSAETKPKKRRSSRRKK
jgi:hypothetical protein